MKKFTGKINEESEYSKYKDFQEDIENLYISLNTINLLLDEGHISHTKLKKGVEIDDVNVFLDTVNFKDEEELEEFILTTLSEMQRIGEKYSKKYNNISEANTIYDRFEVVFFGKYSGHGSVQKNSFQEALEFAKESKKDLYKEDDEVLDKTLYIGVESDSKIAVIYMTKEYYDYIKTLPKDEISQDFLECAEKYIETGEVQVKEIN